MNEISKQNAEILGLDTMTFQTMEECGELIKAISKFNRTRGIGQKTETSIGKAFNDVLAEIADVEICIEQLKYLLEQRYGVNVSNIIELNKHQAFTKVAKRYRGGENQ